MLAALARPLVGWRGLMVLALAAVFAGLFTLPWLRDQLAIVVLPAHLVALSVGIAAVGCVLLLLAWPISRLPAGNREPKPSQLAGCRTRQRHREPQPGGGGEWRIAHGGN